MSRVLLVCGLLLLLCGCSRGMIAVNESFSLSPGDTRLAPLGDLSRYQFQFSSSGSFLGSVILNPPPAAAAAPASTNYSVQVLFCSQSALSGLGVVSSVNAFILNVCLDWNLTGFTSACEYRQLLGWNSLLPVNGSVQLQAEVRLGGEGGGAGLSDDFFYFLIFNCAHRVSADSITGNAVSGQYSAIAQSRPGEYLSLSQLPFKSLYVVASALWLLLLGVWCLHLLQHRRWNIRLQAAMLAVPVSKIWVGVPWTLYWHAASRTGLLPWGLGLLADISDALDGVVFVSVLIVIAKGWGVLHAALTRQWRREYVAYVGLLLAAIVAWRLFPLYLLPALVIMALSLFRYIFISVLSNTIAIISTLQSLLQLPQLDPTSTPLWRKLHQYKLYQLSLVLYASLALIVYIWSGIFLLKLPWVNAAGEALLCLALAVAVGWAFWLRPFNPYYYFIVMLYSQRGEQGEPAPASSAAAAAAGAAQGALSDGSAAAGDDSSRRRRERRERRQRRRREEELLGPYAAGGDDAMLDISAGRRALRVQNQDMRLSLLGNDFLEQPPAPRAPPSASSAASPSVDWLPCWRPGMAFPPIPSDPKQWLVTEEEQDAPILILENPDSSLLLGQFVSDVPTAPRIPPEALRFFPPDLVDMLRDDDDSEDEKDKDEEERRQEERRRAQSRGGAAGQGGGDEDDERMAARSPAVRRVSSSSSASPSESSASSARRVSYAPPSLSSSLSGRDSEDSWRREEDDELRAELLARQVSLQQMPAQAAGGEAQGRKIGEDEAKNARQR